MSSFAFAGYYRDAVLDQSGTPLPNTSVSVVKHGTDTPANLYTSHTKGTDAANPATTDDFGNLAIWAEPGLYDCRVMVNGTQTQFEIEVSAYYVEQAGVPSGMVMAYPVAYTAPGSWTITSWEDVPCPAGWIPCLGQAISRDAFADLFALFGTSFGHGDGSTTFNVPDYHGRFLLGVAQVEGDSYGSPQVPDSGGNWEVALDIAHMPAHGHNSQTGSQNQDHGHPSGLGSTGFLGHSASTGKGLATPGDNAAVYLNSGTHTKPQDTDHQHEIDVQGGGESFSVMPPWASVIWCVKA
jgi:microcystin-dependent protein